MVGATTVASVVGSRLETRCCEPGPLFLGPPLDPAEPSGVGCLGVRQGLSPVPAQPLREGVGRNPQDTPRAVGVLLPHLRAYVGGELMPS